MKSIVLSIVSLLITISAFSQNDEKSIKTISIAQYSPTRSGNMPREEALRTKLNQIKLFDEQGNLVEYQELNPSNKQVRSLYRYLDYKDETPTLIEVYNNTNQLTASTKQILNSFNKIDTSYTYLANNELKGIQINQYDINNNLICRIDSSFKYNRTLKWEYEYNGRNEMITRVAFDKEGEIRDTRSYKYDEKGQEYESDLTRANGDYTLFKSMYNSNGDMTDNIWYDKEGLINNHTKFKYVYDKYGNWITKKRSSGKEEANYIWERKIEYYD